MDLETVSADAFGQSLRGFGINLLSPNVRVLVDFLTGAFGVKAHHVSDDFAIVSWDGMMAQIHHDATFRNHPLLNLVPENPPRGAGTQFYIFGVDPDVSLQKAEALGGTIIEPASNKPHGLYEGTVLSPEGYAFSPAVPTREE